MKEVVLVVEQRQRQRQQQSFLFLVPGEQDGLVVHGPVLVLAEVACLLHEAVVPVPAAFLELHGALLLPLLLGYLLPPVMYVCVYACVN